jgi:chromosome segregation ATPase
MSAATAPPDLLEDSTKLVESLQETMKYAKSLEEANVTLQTKAAGLQEAKTKLESEVEALKKAAQPEPALIQKVASVKDDCLDRTLNFLVERELLADGDVEKLASSIRQDPNVALRLVEQVAAVTANPVASGGGRGISKTAGERDNFEKGASAPIESGGFGSAREWLDAG